jgi:hypothetical protein
MTHVRKVRAPTSPFTPESPTHPATPKAMTTPPTTPAPTMQFAFVFLDFTTSATPTAMKPAQLFGSLVNALIEQLEGAFAQYWGEQCCDFRIGTSTSDRLPGEIAVNFRDTIAAQGALADHQVNNGVADIEVAVDLFTSLSSGQESLSVGVDHEVLETILDRGANGWKDRQDESGLSDAEEACDFVQNTNYAASNGLSMSNFILPSFFVPGAVAPWDYLGKMTSWRDVSNGYGIVAESPTDESQVGGMLAPVLGMRMDHRGVRVSTVGHLSELAKKRKMSPYSRHYRRGGRVK